jgi:ribosomal protein S18 acetylase RimI-like enzyme
MNDIVVRAMRPEDLHIHMMDGFDRYQEITRIVRKHGRVKKLRKPRVENWPAEGKTQFIKGWFIQKVYMRQFYPGQPQVFAAFRGDQVAGFAIWGRDKNWGEEQGYAVLLRLFVSRECRRMGLGRQLFSLCAGAAKAEGAQKLFISTEPAVETQEFYKSMGCAAAKKRLFGPKTDVPLEFRL